MRFGAPRIVDDVVMAVKDCSITYNVLFEVQKHVIVIE